jgi:hypothetical protein
MAKAIKQTITLPNMATLKVEKLTDRTTRSIREGDYLRVLVPVRGIDIATYTRVASVSGEKVETYFGSFNQPFPVSVGKGEKVDIYRPTH